MRNNRYVNILFLKINIYKVIHYPTPELLSLKSWEVTKYNEILCKIHCNHRNYYLGKSITSVIQNVMTLNIHKLYNINPLYHHNQVQ